jgi:hypothetical protein
MKQQSEINSKGVHAALTQWKEMHLEAHERARSTYRLLEIERAPVAPDDKISLKIASHWTGPQAMQWSSQAVAASQRPRKGRGGKRLA